MSSPLDHRPLIVAVTGPNGAGKTTFYHAHLKTAGLRFAMRVSQGGHDVPTEKIVARYPRTLANLRSAIRELPHVWIFDNDNLREPFRKVAVYEQGRRVFTDSPTPKWLRGIPKDGPGR